MPGCYKKASALPVSHHQREILEQIVRRYKSQQQHVKRAQIILMGGDGFGNQQIADELHIDRKTVYHWRQRWLGQIDYLGQVEAGLLNLRSSREEKLILFLFRTNKRGESFFPSGTRGFAEHFFHPGTHILYRHGLHRQQDHVLGGLCDHRRNR